MKQEVEVKNRPNRRNARRESYDKIILAPGADLSGRQYPVSIFPAY